MIGKRMITKLKKERKKIKIRKKNIIAKKSSSVWNWELGKVTRIIKIITIKRKQVGRKKTHWIFQGISKWLGLYHNCGRSNNCSYMIFVSFFIFIIFFFSTSLSAKKYTPLVLFDITFCDICTFGFWSFNLVLFLCDRVDPIEDGCRVEQSCIMLSVNFYSLAQSHGWNCHVNMHDRCTLLKIR